MMKLSKETRTFGCLTLLGVLALGAVWGWFAFTALPVVNIPSPALPKPNAFDTYAQAITAKVSAPSDLQKQLYPSYVTKKPAGPYPTARAQAWLKQNENALQLLRQGLKQQYREPPVRSMTAITSYYAGYRELARILSTESATRGQLGNWKGAADSALDAVHFGYQLPHGAPLIGALVGYAVQSIGRKALQDTLPHLDAATCRQIARRLEALQAGRVPFYEVMTEEKWHLQGGMLQLMKAPGLQSLPFQILGGGGKNSRFRLSSRRRVMAEFGTFMDALIASAKQPYTLAAAPPVPNNFFVASTADSYGRARWNDARNETAHSLLMLAFALRAYQLEHGAFPETLAQLAPQYIAKVPADGFGGGEPLRYKKTGDKYRLWSIGSDKKDDGGKAVDNPRANEATKRHFMQPDSQGDFVFGVNR